MYAGVFGTGSGGKSPAVIFFNGGAGFRRLNVGYAMEFAGQGYVVIAACRFGGQYAFDASGALIQVPPESVSGPIVCPNGPTGPLKKLTTDAVADVRAVVAAARTLPGVDPERIALMGHSYGAQAVVLAASTGERVQALVAFATPFAPGAPLETRPLSVLAGLSAPVLVEHARDDQIAVFKWTQEYVDAAKAAGKLVDMRYFASGGHSWLFAEPGRRESIEAAATFLMRHLLGRN